MMKFEAILFDLDGTLIDTVDDIGDAVNRMLINRGFQTHSLSTYKQLIGEGSKKLITRALPKGHRDEKNIHACLKEFIEDYSRNFNRKSRPYVGVPELLDVLKVKNVKLAVLSNKPDSITKKCVTALLSEWDFDVVTGQRDNIPRKPNPKGAIEVSKKMAIPASHFIYVGDTAIDMQTAVSAGMFPVGVLWGFRPMKELKENGARAIVAEPLRILDFFKWC